MAIITNINPQPEPQDFYSKAAETANVLQAQDLANKLSRSKLQAIGVDMAVQAQRYKLAKAETQLLKEAEEQQVRNAAAAQEHMSRQLNAIQNFLPQGEVESFKLLTSNPNMAGNPFVMQEFERLQGVASANQAAAMGDRYIDITNHIAEQRGVTPQEVQQQFGDPQDSSFDLAFALREAEAEAELIQQRQADANARQRTVQKVQADIAAGRIPQEKLEEAERLLLQLQRPYGGQLGESPSAFHKRIANQLHMLSAPFVDELGTPMGDPSLVGVATETALTEDIAEQKFEEALQQQLEKLEGSNLTPEARMEEAIKRTLGMDPGAARQMLLDLPGLTASQLNEIENAPPEQLAAFMEILDVTQVPEPRPQGRPAHENRRSYQFEPESFFNPLPVKFE
jgi:hypothetical protein